MKRVSIIIFIMFTVNFSVLGQTYVEGGKTRHRFAQLNLGLDEMWLPAAGSSASFLNNSNQPEAFELKSQLETRLIIGGTHFWGHADFYIAIPVFRLMKSELSTGVETGTKYYPWRIERKKIRPYVGMSMLPINYKQGQGANHWQFNFPIAAGLAYCFKNNLIELGLGYNYQNTFDYYISKSTITKVKIPPTRLTLSYKFIIDATLGAEQQWQSGKTKKLTDTLALLNRLNGFTIAAGPSSAFILKSSPHNNHVAPYAGDHKSFEVFPEFGLGYYLHNPDLHFNISYRSMKNQISAYDFEQTAKRKAFTVETFKFLTDYHGFAFFAGLNISYEQLSVRENVNQHITKGTYHGVKPGLNFGWDIRPNRLQAWYLRTNLRYFPSINVKMPDDKLVPFDLLEFNFIQLVIFPGRLI